MGKRPYEIVWAGRTKDDHPPLVDFESLAGWRVKTRNAVATFELSEDEQLWGRYVGKLTYRGTGKSPVIELIPPNPIKSRKPFDCVNFWVYGNNVLGQDPSTPAVDIYAVFQGVKGKKVEVFIHPVNWKYWHLIHRKLSSEQLQILKNDASFVSIRIKGGTNRANRIIYLDNLSVYKERLHPLKFKPRPKRNLILFPGQSPSPNVGPGTLPFPTREETILPDNLTRDYTVDLQKEGNAYIFHYRGNDGDLKYKYEPRTGTLDDVKAVWEGDGTSFSFRPLVGGGVFFYKPRPYNETIKPEKYHAEDGNICYQPRSDGEAVKPEKYEFISCRRKKDGIIARWRLKLGSRSAEITYTFRLWQKSLVVDIICKGGEIGEFRIGSAAGVKRPRLVNLPYLTYRDSRPAVLVMGKPKNSLFLTAFLDHYRSHATKLFAVNKIIGSRATYNGGSRYMHKTDGKRNDCFERLFVTMSPRLEEVLPNIPNPKSPWMHVTGERLWRAYGARNREKDYAYWKKIARYGMTKLIITDHETCWRDGDESFTLRTRAAPGKGGDKGQREYTRKMHDLGFLYGIYNTYTDYIPISEHWNEDCVTREPDGQWHETEWYRTYNLKPSRAVELEAELAPIIQRKFRLNTGYCDVHTCVTPWKNCDYDTRVPGAGTFAAVFYAYGEILLHQKRTWKGPVYSEGRQHWYYCGLSDGDYAQDQNARLACNPWLVDFDLLKMHPLGCNFGMGMLEMFYGWHTPSPKAQEELETCLDRFLAATVAFGHTGFLFNHGGIPLAARSYFMLQQLQANYARETAAEIRYLDSRGRWQDTSGAVASGAFKRSQVATRYSNGLLTLVNGHPSRNLKYDRDGLNIELPPNGYFGYLPGGKGNSPRLWVFSGEVKGHRVDYADTPEYVYADGRGRFTHFPKAGCDGAIIAHLRKDGKVELIPIGRGKRFGVNLDGRPATAVALDEEGKELKPAKTRRSNGLVFVTPVAGAFSYLLTPTDI